MGSTAVRWLRARVTREGQALERRRGPVGAVASAPPLLPHRGRLPLQVARWGGRRTVRAWTCAGAGSRVGGPADVWGSRVTMANDGRLLVFGGRDVKGGGGSRLASPGTGRGTTGAALAAWHRSPRPGRPCVRVGVCECVRGLGRRAVPECSACVAASTFSEGLQPLHSVDTRAPASRDIPASPSPTHARGQRSCLRLVRLCLCRCLALALTPPSSSTPPPSWTTDGAAGT